MEVQMKKGLYYNINRRKKLGLPPRQPGEKGYPTREAFVRSAKTAKKTNRKAKR